MSCNNGYCIELQCDGEGLTHENFSTNSVKMWVVKDPPQSLGELFQSLQFSELNLLLLRTGFNHAMLVEIAIQKLVDLGLMESSVWIFGATSVRMIHRRLLHVEVMDLESKDVVEDVKKATTSSWANFTVHQVLHQLEKLSVPHFRRLMTRWMVEHKSGGWKLVSILLSLPGLWSYCSTGKT